MTEATADRPRPASVLLSLLAVLAAGMATFGAVLEHAGSLLRNDGTAYFLYARSLVADRDLDVSAEYRHLDALLPADSPVLMAVRYSARPVPGTERTAFPWPYGAGVLMAPFYALGYGVERLDAALAGRSPDSFGTAPQLGYGLGALLFGLVGFWATWLCCRQAGTGSREATLAALAVTLGGPVVFYVFFHPTMAHAPSFGLVALLTFLWWRRWEGAGPPLAVLWLLAGLAVFVRYQNAVFALLPLSLLVRGAVRRRGRRSFAAPAGLSLALLPLALLALSLLAGGAGAEPLTLAQNDMDLRSPHFFQVLFSCQHGAFYWAPVLGLGFAGLVWAARRAAWARVLGLVFLADVYLVGTLEGFGGTNWSGGHAFGMRYLAECAPLVAPGLAFLLRRTGGGAGRAGGVRRLAWAGVLALLVAGNGLLVLAYAAGGISRSGCVTYPEMAAGAARALSSRPMGEGG